MPATRVAALIRELSIVFAAMGLPPRHFGSETLGPTGLAGPITITLRRHTTSSAAAEAGSAVVFASARSEAPWLVSRRLHSPLVLGPLRRR